MAASKNMVSWGLGLSVSTYENETLGSRFVGILDGRALGAMFCGERDVCRILLDIGLRLSCDACHDVSEASNDLSPSAALLKGGTLVLSSSPWLKVDFELGMFPFEILGAGLWLLLL